MSVNTITKSIEEKNKVIKCKKTVYRNRGLIDYQCNRKAIKDGYCWQHHPNFVKEQERKAEKRLEATPFSMIHRY